MSLWSRKSKLTLPHLLVFPPSGIGILETLCAFAMAAFAIISKAKARGRNPSIAAQAPDSSKPHRVWTLDSVERAYKASLRMLRALAFRPAPPNCDTHWLFEHDALHKRHAYVYILSPRPQQSLNQCLPSLSQTLSPQSPYS
ncbi:hypothetical protein E4T42_01755 [Aureobasidium subglaciale]|nr:hypothetical protein E4T42_01755 [Aureobasidium subglaciale]